MDKYHETTPPTKLKSAVMGGIKEELNPDPNCSSVVWTRTSQKPLCSHKTEPCRNDGITHTRCELDVEWGQMMLFAIRLSGNRWDYHLGHISDDGTVVDTHGDDVGWMVENVDLYAIIGKPYAPLL